jgi:hypothetical protein
MDTLMASRFSVDRTATGVSYSNIPQYLIGTFFPSHSLTVSKLLEFNLLEFSRLTSLWVIKHAMNEAPPEILTNEKLHAMQHPPQKTIARFLETAVWKIKPASIRKCEIPALPAHIRSHDCLHN